jgi:hypothetical protein
MDENSDDTVTAGKSSELLPGWEIFVDWLFVTNAMPQSIEPFSISLASSSLSDTYETASRVSAKSNFRKEIWICTTAANVSPSPWGEGLVPVRKD